MEGNRVQKSKHANFLIQSCNHVNVTVSTMYVCDSGGVSYVSRKCISQYCSLHFCNCLITYYTFLFIKMYHCFLAYIRGRPYTNSVYRLRTCISIPYKIASNMFVELTCLSNCDIWPYMERKRKLTIIAENRNRACGRAGVIVVPRCPFLMFADFLLL